MQQNIQNQKHGLQNICVYVQVLHQLLIFHVILSFMCHTQNFLNVLLNP